MWKLQPARHNRGKVVVSRRETQKKYHVEVPQLADNYLSVIANATDRLQKPVVQLEIREVPQMAPCCPSACIIACHKAAIRG